jgi:hypothetical protein
VPEGGNLRGDLRPGANIGGVVVVGDVVAGALDDGRDRYWPRSALTLMLLAVGFTAAAVQLVTPTRRWRPRLPGIPRRRRPGRSVE